MSLWKARYLSRSAVVGRPYFAEGRMVACASTVFPFNSRRKKTIFSLDLAPRCFAGVKNPRVFRFFSILTKSLGVWGEISVLFGVTATEPVEEPLGVRTVSRITKGNEARKLLMRKG